MKVQVTVSPALRVMFVTGLPSEQVALACRQSNGTVSAMLYPEPGLGTVNVFDWPLARLNPVVQVGANSNACVLSSGFVVLRTMIVAGCGGGGPISRINVALQKTVTVSLVRRYAHPVYGKQVTRTKKVKARNDHGAKAGDTVRIMETRPLAKTVNWRVTEIVERAK